MASTYLGSGARFANTLMPAQKAAGCHRSDFHFDGLASCQSAAADITRSRAVVSMASENEPAPGVPGAGVFEVDRQPSAARSARVIVARFMAGFLSWNQAPSKRHRLGPL